VEVATTANASSPALGFDLTSPPSPVDFDRPTRFGTVRRYVRATRVASPIQCHDVAQTPLVATPTAPPPQTIHEREYRALRAQHDELCTTLRTLHGELHLRMYLLGLLRPSEIGDRPSDAVEAWIRETVE
jgi:hypothetical protein